MRKDEQLFKWIYAFVFFVFAGLVAWQVLFYLYGTLAGVFWLFIFGDGPWPPWAHRVLNSAVVVMPFVTLGAAFFSARQGWIYGGKVSLKKDIARQKAKAYGWFIATVVVCVVWGGVVYGRRIRNDRVREGRKQREKNVEQWTRTNYKITDFNVKQKNNQFFIAIQMEGLRPGSYQLRLECRDDYLTKHAVFYSREERLNLRLPQEEVHYQISFKDIEQGFRELLNDGRITSFERPFGFSGKDIIFCVKLTPLETGNTPIRDVPLSKKEAVIRTDIRCHKNSCHIIKTEVLP